jgi:hypothetical protein
MRTATALLVIIAIFTLMLSVTAAKACYGKDGIVAEAHEDNVVVPGERVGWMKLGMKFDNVTKRLGNDYKVAGSNQSDLVFPKYQLTFSLSGNKDTIQGIGVMGSDYRTEAGIQVGSTEAQVVSAYGNPDSTASPSGGSCRILRYNARGITFVMSRGGRVVSFCIFR